MREQTKPAAAAPTTETGTGSQHDQAQDPRREIVSRPTPKVNEKILSLIPFGRDNAVHVRDIVSLTGLPERNIRRMIEHARREGAFILSGDCGFWMADPSTETSAAKIMCWYCREGGRIRALARRLEPVRQRVEAARAVGTDQVKIEGV